MHNTFKSEKKFELYEKVKVGRQVSPKTAPEPTNGYFDSKVLSRSHAEFWADGDKVYIKDVKSSNGTYLNGHRLSGDGQESLPKLLFDGDIIEFGIDIYNENGSSKTII
ncbi:hypothetical protein K502DRAFT_294796 [Neoconidiobolus thromboides FSU 785]|nr:hypothetical protein K502DRAFT_294796 [Neoconidiobolus thromboides FSU 785]